MRRCVKSRRRRTEKTETDVQFFDENAEECIVRENISRSENNKYRNSIKQNTQYSLTM